MNDRDNRIHQMGIRVRGFMNGRVADFPATGMTMQLHNRLGAALARLESQSAAQASGFAEARQGATTIGDARLALRQSLIKINRAARAMGVGDKFPLPQKSRDRNLIQAGRGTLIEALPLKDDFILHDMPADFLTELTADIEDMEGAIAARDEAVDGHVNARAGISEATDEILDIVNDLDGLIKNKYADDPATLAGWLAASHVERAPRRRQQQPPATPTQPPAPPG